MQGLKTNELNSRTLSLKDWPYSLKLAWHLGVKMNMSTEGVKSIKSKMLVYSSILNLSQDNVS